MRLNLLIVIRCCGNGSDRADGKREGDSAASRNGEEFDLSLPP